MTLEELLKGKETVIRNKEYFATAKYVQPFIDRVKEFTTNFQISVKTPDQMTGSVDNPDITFNRVCIHAILPNKVDDYNEVIGFCYSLDSRKPVAKFYKCYMNTDNNTILAFNPNWIFSQPIEENEPLEYMNVKKVLELTDDVKIKIDKFKNILVSWDELDALLGNWIRKIKYLSINSEFGKVKLAITNAIDAFELLFEDTDSDYYCGSGTNLNMFDCYESFSQTIADDKKDIINKFEKSILINNILIK